MNIHQNPFAVIDTRLSNIENLLLDIKHSPQTLTQEKQTNAWFTLTELCEYHPDKPTKATVYGWVNAGTIPVHKGGKKLRFLKSEIDEWLKQGRKKTRYEAANEAEHYLTAKRVKDGF